MGAQRGPGSNQHQDKPPLAPRDPAADAAPPSSALEQDPFEDEYPYEDDFPPPLSKVQGGNVSTVAEATQVDLSDVERGDRVVAGDFVEGHLEHGVNVWPTSKPQVVMLGTFDETGRVPDSFTPVDLAKLDAQGHDHAGTTERLFRVHKEEWAAELASGTPDPSAAAERTLRRVVEDPTAGTDDECGWMVRTGAHPDDGTDIVEDCCAPTVNHDRGWSCGRGHRHESGAQYYDEEELARGDHAYARGPAYDMRGDEPVW